MASLLWAYTPPSPPPSFPPAPLQQGGSMLETRGCLLGVQAMFPNIQPRSGSRPREKGWRAGNVGKRASQKSSVNLIAKRSTPVAKLVRVLRNWYQLMITPPPPPSGRVYAVTLRGQPGLSEPAAKNNQQLLFVSQAGHSPRLASGMHFPRSSSAVFALVHGNQTPYLGHRHWHRS
ncbi:hypothetical protein BT67DRAFT_72863 [Trichocladium antarcticum]|uniref:Uncharacterized protein n=1 Tax=Trichocladium antarcticum TaxID=1450529 RepID=A0AAN6UGW3_9PEZI|nr:hypothetical protein BT67DRAFT_72863 [Trichocladium antarcticum]